jgi:hypothetical protein
MPKDPWKDYLAVIRRTNETGLASRHDYEIAFGATAREQREVWLGITPLLAAFRDRGVDIGGLYAIGAFRPDEPLPGDLSTQLQRINDVVEATPTQVLHAREQGGQSAEGFSVHGRMECGTIMVIVGDTAGTRVRGATWRSDDEGGWTLSRSTLDAARRYGLTKTEYVQMATDPKVGLLPPVEAADVEAAHARDVAAGKLEDGVWVCFASVVDLVTANGL